MIATEAIAQIEAAAVGAAEADVEVPGPWWDALLAVAKESAKLHGPFPIVSTPFCFCGLLDCAQRAALEALGESVES